MVRAAGVGGELRVGHYGAARLGRWSVVTVDTLGPAAAELEAAVVWSDGYWRTQGITSVQLQVGAEVWTWHQLRDVVLTGERVRARLVGLPQ